jgi:hypothetical protein
MPCSFVGARDIVGLILIVSLEVGVGVEASIVGTRVGLALIGFPPPDGVGFSVKLDGDRVIEVDDVVDVVDVIDVVGDVGDVGDAEVLVGYDNKLVGDGDIVGNKISSQYGTRASIVINESNKGLLLFFLLLLLVFSFLLSVLLPLLFLV